MCGIAGAWNLPVQKSDYEPYLKDMLARILHRGPDEAGIYSGNRLGLGSVRLSIVDLSTGSQPLCDSSGEYWIVYNGEVFNYPELRLMLEKKGVRFHTTSDTEVVVQMYALYGPDCLSYFNGQFAFCIWNKTRKEMFLARDRMGIRPLFYWHQGESFAFCSEIKGLFALDCIPRQLEANSLSQVFTFWSTFSPDTMFAGINELPPAHYMLVSDGQINIQRYWQLQFPTEPVNTSSNINQSAEELNELLKDAVRIRLRADVPVGAYLSGGLDSSVTTALIHEIDPGVLNTYSIGFRDKNFDETSYQQEVAQFFNTNHTAFECTSDEIANQFESTIWHSETPVLRTSPTPMYMLSRQVRNSNIKVVITGEGADEILAGYNIYKEAKIRRFWAHEPDSQARPRLLSKLYPYLPMMRESNPLALRMFFGYKLTDTDDPLYSHLLRWHNTSRISSYFSAEFRSLIDAYNPLDQVYASLPSDFSKWSSLAQSQYLEATIFMSGYLLSSQGDRMAMGNSVEGRYPFLDYRVIEFASRLPDRYKLNCLNEKYILKKLSEGRIPQSITRRPKQAYRAPIAGSFFGKNAPGYVAEILSDDTVNQIGIFDSKRVQALKRKIENQNNVSEIDQMALAGIISTQLLYNLFISDKHPQLEVQLPNLKVVKES